MTDIATIPTWPRIEALTRPDGSGEVTINGTSHPIDTRTVQAARDEILRRVVETAAKVGRPVRVSTTGPDGTWPIIVHPDGTIETDTDQATTDPARTDRRQRRTNPAPAAVPVEQAQLDTPASADAPVAEIPAASAPPTAPEGVPAADLVADLEDPAIPDRSEDPGTDPDAAVPRRSFLTQEQVEEPATGGWRGFLTRIGFHVAPTAAERAKRDDTQAVSQHWPGPRTIAIVNGKGGASKTPSTILLAAVFARYGGAGVLAWDNNQTRGTLGWRTEQGPHEATLLDLIPQTDRLLSTSAQSADLARYVHHQTRDHFDVLRSKPMALADEQRVKPGDVDAIWAVAGKYYRLVFMDSGNDESDPMWLRMIDHADQLVVATTTRNDHAEAGALLLEALQQRDDHSARLAANAVAIVSQADPMATAKQLHDVAQGYTSLAREVVTVPHDPAMVDGILRYDVLRPATQRAWLAASAAIARGL